MERDFEQEFRELKLSEVPDLWNRIEAGLSEKKVMASALAAPSSANGMLSDKQYPSAKQKVNNRSWFRWNWARWVVAAACLCLAIMLPTLFKTLGIMDKSYSNDTATSEADGMYNSSADNAGKAETAEAEDADIMYDDGMADASDSVEMEEEAGEPNDAMTATEDMSDAVGAASTEADKEMAVEAPFMLADGQILERVVVQIADVELSGDEITYHAVVQQPDTDGILADGMRITLVCDADTEYDIAHNPRENIVLQNDESYEVSLRYESYGGQSDDEAVEQFGESLKSDLEEADVEGIFLVILANQ